MPGAEISDVTYLKHGGCRVPAVLNYSLLYLPPLCRTGLVNNPAIVSKGGYFRTLY
ncbi:hypothetical protein [Pontibacter sp. Tf4]|uniref:hypothetical protein n=1 Tax=Pontibacter sp. Tf4 TaxID=2761620 RepID=UPI001626AFCA|nr:hypothetical protein [Pontibacter sp. Tf4]